VGAGNGHLGVPGEGLSIQSVRQCCGPGGGVEKISASGRVYKLANLSDFAGQYARSTGKAGFRLSGSRDLWLENNTGVIMHLQAPAPARC
jgi:hypothetical protein